MDANSRFRIILVAPEYEINLGFIARAMKNFNFSDLCIVSPKCNHLGFEAIKYSKHAKDVLEKAKIYKSLEEAAAGCKFVIGTTGVLFRHTRKTFRNPISLTKLREKLQKQKEGKIALVFGSEGAGLCLKDISFCDFLVTIPTSSEYPILNLSHAVAIFLYELSGIQLLQYTEVDERQKKQLIHSFNLLVDCFAKRMRNPKKVKIAFKRIIGRSLASDKECAAVLGVLRRAHATLKKKNKKKSLPPALHYFHF